MIGAFSDIGVDGPIANLHVRTDRDRRRNQIASPFPGGSPAASARAAIVTSESMPQKSRHTCHSHSPTALF
jgi:hypothetical protein